LTLLNLKFRVQEYLSQNGRDAILHHRYTLTGIATSADPVTLT